MPRWYNGVQLLKASLVQPAEVLHQDLGKEHQKREPKRSYMISWCGVLDVTHASDESCHDEAMVGCAWD